MIGAGIAGLAAAYRLRNAGMEVTVFEQGREVGGRIRSVIRGDFLYDVGAFIYLGSYSESIAMMREVGLGPHICRVDAYGAMPRDWRLHYLDLKRPLRSIMSSRYLSTAGKLKSARLFWLLARYWKGLMPLAIAATLDVRLSCPVVGVIDRGGDAEVTWRSAAGERSGRFEAVVIATTADRALGMYPQMSGVQRELYESTEYIVSVNTHLALSRRPADPAGYIMVSQREHQDLCGVIVDHKKAPGRAPADRGMITVFCRHEWCQRNFEVADEQIVSQVLDFIRPYYDVSSRDVCDYAIGRWPQVVPIMRKGRFMQIAAYEKSLNASSVIQLAGDLDPIGGVNAALVSGERAASLVARRFGRPLRGAPHRSA